MLLHRRFIKVAKKAGQKLAFNDRTSEKRVTYNKALIAALILADKFRTFPKGFVGIMIPTSAGCALSILGVLMSGRTPVMINYATGAAHNARYAQKKCNFKAIVTSKALLEKINCPVVEGMIFIEDIMESVSGGDKLRALMRAKMPEFFLSRRFALGSENETAFILFTSGSEKDPKAVELTHKNIISNVVSFSKAADIGGHDVMLANLPFFHVFGLTVNLWTALYHGMTIVSYANPLDYRTICTIVREENPTIMVGTPSFFSGYLKKSEPGDFESLNLIVAGAEKCPDTLRKEFLKKHGKVVYEGYGTTETSPVISVNLPGRNKPGSVGKVMEGVELRIENYETGEDCAAGETGRILVKGDLLMKGYFDDFEETSMRVRHGWYDTGDMGYLDSDGFLWHAGRLKRFVKIGGEMVSLVNVESVLEKVLPEGVLCCVVELPDPVKSPKIVAVVTHTVDERKILRKMAETLPNIALPKQFFIVEEVPKMGSGKIDFRSVTRMAYALSKKSEEDRAKEPPAQ